MDGRSYRRIGGRSVAQLACCWVVRPGALIGNDAGTAATIGEGLLLENTAQKLNDGSTAVGILAQNPTNPWWTGSSAASKLRHLVKMPLSSNGTCWPVEAYNGRVERQAHEGMEENSAKPNLKRKSANLQSRH